MNCGPMQALPAAAFSPPPAARTLAVCRAAARFCGLRGWAPVTEMPLPNGRRADILALLPDGRFVVIEVKSCARDFLSDAKWREYRDYCDGLYFAVDLDFPREILPEEVGLLVTDGPDATLLRDAPSHALAPPREGWRRCRIRPDWPRSAPPCAPNSASPRLPGAWPRQS
jgi:hypothetical protein